MRDVGEADVAGLGEHHCADADVEILHAGAAFAEVCERVREVRPAADLEQDLRERDAIGQQRVDVDAQLAELGRLVKGLQRAEVGAVHAADRLNLNGHVGIQTWGRLAVGAIELGAEAIEGVRGVRVVVQARADLGPGRLPRRAAEQLRARVRVPAKTRDEHVTAIERALQCLEHAEAVRAAVKLTVCELWVGEHQALPLPADQLQRNRRRGHPTRAAFDAAQRVQGVEDGPAGAGRLERHDVQQRRQEAPQAGVAAQQLGAKRCVLATRVELGRCEAPDRVAGGLKLAAADASRDRRPQRVQATRGRVEQHEHRGAQAPGGQARAAL